MQNLCISHYHAHEKRRQSDYNDNQNVECRIWDKDGIVGFLHSPLGFLAFALNLTKKIAEMILSGNEKKMLPDYIEKGLLWLAK